MKLFLIKSNDHFKLAKRFLNSLLLDSLIALTNISNKGLGGNIEG